VKVTEPCFPLDVGFLFSRSPFSSAAEPERRKRTKLHESGGNKACAKVRQVAFEAVELQTKGSVWWDCFLNGCFRGQ